MLKIQYLDTEIRISDVAIIWIVVDKEKNAAFTVVMGRLGIKGDAVPAAILSKGGLVEIYYLEHSLCYGKTPTIQPSPVMLQ